LRPYLKNKQKQKRARGVVQAVEYLPSKFKAQYHQKKKKKRKLGTSQAKREHDNKNIGKYNRSSLSLS
jgi:hypothetical protein